MSYRPNDRGRGAHHSSCRCAACERRRERARSRALEKAKRELADFERRHTRLFEKRG